METEKEKLYKREIKELEKQLDSLYEREAELAKILFWASNEKIIIHKSYPEWAELQELHKRQDILFEQIKKKEEEYLTEFADVVPVEIIGALRPILNGKNLYLRILIKVLWKYRKPYGKI